ncbi:MAG: CBS domain-containing protein [Chloroflexi bacterium]|nr:CBS domain-containing protein [Chloroflexota bacterium]
METVAELMTRDVAIIEADVLVSKAMENMENWGVSSLLVLPGSIGDSYGIITRRDIVTKVAATGSRPSSRQVRDVMSKPVITISPGWSLRDCSILMEAANIRHLPVIVKDATLPYPRPTGMIRDVDIFSRLNSPGYTQVVERRRRQRILMRLRARGQVRTVADIMSSPALWIEKQARLEEALALMHRESVSSLLVEPEGIITRRTIIAQVVAHNKDLTHLLVTDVMRTPVATIEADSDLRRCAARMAELGVRRLPVILDGEILGIVSNSDIFAALELQEELRAV